MLPLVRGTCSLGKWRGSTYSSLWWRHQRGTTHHYLYHTTKAHFALWATAVSFRIRFCTTGRILSLNFAEYAQEKRAWGFKCLHLVWEDQSSWGWNIVLGWVTSKWPAPGAGGVRKRESLAGRISPWGLTSTRLCWTYCLVWCKWMVW
jgi:hypothetical protein